MARRLEDDAPHCVYTETALARAEWPCLTGEHRAQVMVVGAGYTGLSAALNLAEAGVDVWVLEAHEPGFGAAGRNGGQVNAGLKHEPEQIARHFGEARAERLIRLSSQAPDDLFRLIERLHIDCEARREGTLRAAYRSADVSGLHESARQWRTFGITLDVLDSREIHRRTGSARYLAGLYDPRGGSVQPLSLARGLAVAAHRAGARVYANTRITALSPEGALWRASSASGTLRAERVIIATDGYSDALWPGLKQSILPIYSAIIATELVDPHVTQTVLPMGGVLYESGDITVYYRKSRDGRLLLGGRGRQWAMRDPRAFRHLADYVPRLWPILSGVRITHWWNGQFALTPDYYPRVHAPANGVFIGLGYSGRGVAMGVALGAELARAATGTPLDELALPPSAITPIPLHRFWRVGVELKVAWARLKERL